MNTSVAGSAADFTWSKWWIESFDLLSNNVENSCSATSASTPEIESQITLNFDFVYLYGSFANLIVWPIIIAEDKNKTLLTTGDNECLSHFRYYHDSGAIRQQTNATSNIYADITQQLKYTFIRLQPHWQCPTSATGVIHNVIEYKANDLSVLQPRPGGTSRTSST